MKTILPSLVAFALTLVVGVFFSLVPFENQDNWRQRNVHPDKFSPCEALEYWGAKVEARHTGELGRVVYSRRFFDSDDQILFVMFGDTYSEQAPKLALHSKQSFRKYLILKKEGTRVGMFCTD